MTRMSILFHVLTSVLFSCRMTVTTRATSTKRRRLQMQTNAELQAEVTALRTQLAARTSKMNAELADANARLNASLPKKVREPPPPPEVVAVQAEATDAAADIDLAHVTYGPWRPDGTRSSHGRYRFGSPGNYVYGGRFRISCSYGSEEILPRSALPRFQSVAARVFLTGLFSTKYRGPRVDHSHHPWQQSCA
jgi:hypothetical protein